MKLDFDPAWLRTSMSMWRDATDLKVPLHDDFKVGGFKHEVQHGITIDGTPLRAS
ncbi:MAG: hypothetical protein Q7K57_25375 [Burkholderiaceae bacterium]|nr:hypothetical protein [Burkholderiaceae bacterium]